MKKPDTIPCIIKERKGLEFALMPDHSNPSSFQEVAMGPRYVAIIIIGKEEREIYIHDDPKKPLNLEEGQTVAIHREPHHLFFYKDEIVYPNGTRKHVNIEW